VQLGNTISFESAVYRLEGTATVLQVSHVTLADRLIEIVWVSGFMYESSSTRD